MLFGKPSTRVGSGSAGGGGSYCIRPRLLGACLPSPRRAPTAARRPQDNSRLAGVTLLVALVLPGCATSGPVAGAGALTQLAASTAIASVRKARLPAGPGRIRALPRTDSHRYAQLGAALGLQPRRRPERLRSALGVARQRSDDRRNRFRRQPQRRVGSQPVLLDIRPGGRAELRWPGGKRYPARNRGVLN